MTKSQQRSRKPSALVIVALVASIGAMSFAALKYGIGPLKTFEITAQPSTRIPVVTIQPKPAAPPAKDAPRGAAVADKPATEPARTDAARSGTAATGVAGTDPVQRPMDPSPAAKAEAGESRSSTIATPAAPAPAAPTAPTAAPPTAERAATAAAAAVVPASLPDDDYYAKRAKDLVERDAAAQAKDMSLAAAFPDRNVVVCEAGCYGRQRSIVFAARRVPTEPVRTAGMMPTSSDATPGVAQVSARAAIDARDVTCVAGCYDGARRVAAVPPAKPMATLRSEIDALAAAADAANPLPSADDGAASRRWMTTSSPAPGTDAAARSSRPARYKLTPRPGASPSGDWFRRIDAERSRRAP